MVVICFHVVVISAVGYHSNMVVVYLAIRTKVMYDHVFDNRQSSNVVCFNMSS